MNNEKQELKKMEEAVKEANEIEENTEDISKKDIEAVLDSKNKEIEELKNQVLRIRAEFDNFRKRNEAQKQEFIKYAHEEVVLGILPILDSFDRALEENIKEEHSTKEIVEGMALISKQLLDSLAKFGVNKIEAKGKKFDPYYHEAVMTEKSEEEPGTVIKEMQRGYMLEEKVVRHSMVIVAE